MKVTKWRTKLRQDALRAGELDELEANQHAVEKLSKKMSRGYFKAQQPREQHWKSLKAEVPVPC